MADGTHRIVIDLGNHANYTEVLDILETLDRLAFHNNPSYEKKDTGGTWRRIDKRELEAFSAISEMELVKRQGDTLWIAAPSEEAAREFANRFGVATHSKWAGPGHYRSNIYIVSVI